MKNPVILKFRTSIQHLKALKNREEAYLNVEKSLKSISKKEEVLENAKRTHNLKLRKIVKNKESWMKNFSKSVPVSLRKLRIFSKEEFPIVLSYIDYTQEPTAHLALECFIQKISIIPFCRYRGMTFPKRLNQYDEHIQDIEIEKYGICILLNLLEKNEDEREFTVDIESESFKISNKEGTVSWNIENISGRFQRATVDPIHYQSISSRKTVKQFKKMIGFTELSKLAKEFL